MNASIHFIVCSVPSELTVLELRLPGSRLLDNTIAPLIELLKRMENLQALYILAETCTNDVFQQILDTCVQLQHFQYVGKDVDNVGYIPFMVMSRPSKRLIVAVSSGTDMPMPAGIDTVEIIVFALRGMKRFAYKKDWENKNSVRYISVSIRPGKEFAEMWEMFFKHCLPNWSKHKSLLKISLLIPGLVAEISRPAELTAPKKIDVTISDPELIPEKWEIPDDYYISVTYSAKFRVNNGDIGFGRLAPIPAIRTVDCKCPKVLELFLVELAKSIRADNVFVGLVKLSGVADAYLDLSKMPYADLSGLGNLKAIFFQRKNQPFALVDVSICRDASSERILSKPNGLCFYREKAQAA